MDNLAQYIEYTNLHNNTNRKQVNKMIADCIEHNFYGLCISPGWVLYAKNRFKNLNKDIKVITVPNWCMGGGLLQCEGSTDMVCEIADEIDYILNVYEFSDLKAWDRNKKELEIIRKKTKGTLKVIIEAYYLRNSDEKIYKLGLNRVFKESCKLVEASGANMLKTDSGLFKRPDFDSLLEDIKLMKKYSKLKIKAAGGIRTYKQVKQLLDLGVARIGSSTPIQILEESKKVDGSK